MIVVDASAALEVRLNARRAAGVAARIVAHGETLHAPHVIDVEVTQVLRRLARRGEIDAARSAQVLEDLASVPGCAARVVD